MVAPISKRTKYIYGLWLVICIALIGLFALPTPAMAGNNEIHPIYIGDVTFNESCGSRANSGFVTIYKQTASDGNTFMGYDFRVNLLGIFEGHNIGARMRILIDDEVYIEDQEAPTPTMWCGDRYTYNKMFNKVEIQIENRTGVTGVVHRFRVSGQLKLGLALPTITVTNNIIERIEMLEKGGAGTPPSIVKVQGHKGTTATTGDAFNVVVQASSATEFRVKVEGGNWSEWTPVDTYATATGLTGTGAHMIHAEARNAAGDTAVGQMVVFRV